MSRVETTSRPKAKRGHLARWSRLAVAAGHEFLKDEIPTVAAGVTYFMLLAFFPAIAAFVSLYGLVADVQTAHEHLNILRGVLPPDVLSLVANEMIRVTTTHSSQLSFAFVLSIVVSLWSANAGVTAVMGALNIAYEKRESRGIVRFYLISLAITGVAIVAAIGAVVLVVALPVMENAVGVEIHFSRTFVWPIEFAVSVLVLTAIYRYGPDRAKAGPRCLFPGAIVASLVGLGGSLLFSWYVNNFAHYDRTYGPFGAIIGFMIWIWLIVVVFLFGAELNGQIEKGEA